MSTEEEKPTTEAPEATPETKTDNDEKKTEAVKEEESTATFEPVVKLEEVDVKSGEEEESVIYSQRSKLFIFGETLLDKGTGKKTWRERGIGEARILRHNEHQRLRLLMRQEKTMKVIANHAIDPRIKLEPNAGSDRSWVWSAFDFANGELVETVFALRFADTEIANAFKEEFEKGQKEMESLLAGEDKSGEDSAAADEAAEALASLKTKEEGEE
jgi:Ran-binding protein 1|eukprot:364897_1